MIIKCGIKEVCYMAELRGIKGKVGELFSSKMTIVVGRWPEVRVSHLPRVVLLKSPRMSLGGMHSAMNRDPQQWSSGLKH